MESSLKRDKKIQTERKRYGKEVINSQPAKTTKGNQNRTLSVRGCNKHNKPIK